MRPGRTALRFILLLALSYALLIAPWPGLESGYARVFRTGAQRVLRWYGPDGEVRFEPGSAQDETHDTILLALNKKTGAYVGMGIDTRCEGYIPVAFLLALILSSPIPWMRRIWALVWGLLLVHVFIAMKLLVMITRLFSLDHPAALFSVSAFWGRALDGVLQIVAPSPLTWLIVPVFIWIPVTFRREDFTRLLEGADAEREREAGA